MAKSTSKRLSKKGVSRHRRRKPANRRPTKESRRQLRLHADHDALIQAGADEATGGNFTAFLEIAALEKLSRMHARQAGAKSPEVVFPGPRSLALMRHLDEALLMLLRMVRSMTRRLEAGPAFQADEKVQEELVRACLDLVRATYKNAPGKTDRSGRGKKS
jgi:hypothetical protein